MAGVFAVYWPGLSGGFAFDDYPNLVSNSALHIQDLDRASLFQAALSAPDGSGSRPISMLTLGLNYYASGLEPWPYKLTNIIIHGINGSLAGAFLYILLLATGSPNSEATRVRAVRVAFITAVAWALHPIALTSVLYVVQRMTSLSATFVLLGLTAYSWGRWRMIQGDERGWLSVIAAVLCLPLAFLSKENGILLPAYWFILEFLFFRFNSLTARSRFALQVLFVLLLVLPAGLFLQYLIANPDWLSATYQSRDFTLDERLLTQSRVLWTYVGLILLPAVSRMGLFHDDYVISASLFEPWTTAIALTAWVVIVVAAVMWRRRAPIAAFAVLFFVAGHAVESTAVALEIFHEHRNYLPSLGVLLGCTSLILTERVGVGTLRVRQLGLIILCLLLGLLTMSRAAIWADPLTLSEVELAHNPGSARTAYSAGVAWATVAEIGDPAERAEREARAEELFHRSLYLEPGKIEAMTALVILNARRNSPPPDNLWDMLIAEGRRVRLNASAAGGFSALFRCVRSGPCEFPESVLASLTESLLENPTLNSRFGSIILTALSEHLWYVESDSSTAYQFAKKAKEAAPGEVVPILNLANLLVAAGRHVEARALLKDAQERDSLGRYRREIKNAVDRLEKNILEDSLKK